MWMILATAPCQTSNRVATLINTWWFWIKHLFTASDLLTTWGDTSLLLLATSLVEVQRTLPSEGDWLRSLKSGAQLTRGQSEGVEVALHRDASQNGRLS